MPLLCATGDFHAASMPEAIFCLVRITIRSLTLAAHGEQTGVMTVYACCASISFVSDFMYIHLDG